MAWALGALTLVDMTAGAFIAAVGLFVLATAPRSWTNRLFLVFAASDGAATILFAISRSDSSFDVRAAGEGAYWWFQILALGGLAAFGALFPRPVRSPRVARALALAAGALTLAALVAYGLDHAAFWRARAGGAGFARGTLGQLFIAADGLVVAGIVLRTLLLSRRESSRSHRDEAAFILGGIALGYAPGPAGILTTALVTRAPLWSTGPIAAQSIGLAVLLATMLAAAIAALRLEGRARVVVLATLGAALLLVLTSALDAASGYFVQVVAVFTYPLLLAYGVIRYAVFDIDERVRNAATLALAGAAVAGVFLVAENLLQTMLQVDVLSDIETGALSSALAAILAALLLMPLSRAAKKLAKRFVPERGEDALHARKLEIYKHALDGARRGGGDVHAFEALRRSLGITDEEHARLAAAS